MRGERPAVISASITSKAPPLSEANKQSLGLLELCAYGIRRYAEAPTHWGFRVFLLGFQHDKPTIGIQC